MGIRRRHKRRRVDVPLDVDSGMVAFTPTGYRRVSCAEYHRIVKPQMQLFDQMDPALRDLINDYGPRVNAAWAHCGPDVNAIKCYLETGRC